MAEYQATLTPGRVTTPTCRQCGQDIPPRSRYCLWCGQRTGWRLDWRHALIALFALLLTAFVAVASTRQPESGPIMPNGRPAAAVHSYGPYGAVFIDTDGVSWSRSDTGAYWVRLDDNH